MCGIAGIAALAGEEPPSRERLVAMCRTLEHRGPDDEGVAILGGVGLAARRLSIIDLDTGQQPIFNEDRSVCLVFNGEIYNFRELRRELEAAGHRFASAGDGEVVVHLWEEEGPDLLDRLNGMFAIALLDNRRGRLLLARDRIGIKPLYWARTERHLLFGSEVKAILASGLVSKQIDLEAVGEFLSWEYVPAPRTLLRDVRKLEPGSLLLLDLASGEIEERAWWDVPAPEPPGAASGPHGAGEWEDAVDAKIRECVERQLVSDVPLGAFLSGGVDSSLVVAAMGPARAFTVGFEDPTYDESVWAVKAARHLGVRHRLEVLQPRAGELFGGLMEFMDDPIADFSIFPTFLVSRLAREEVKVALSGDGGDELFGGYETYAARRLATVWERLPGALRGVAESWLRSLRPRPQKRGVVNKARRFAEGLEHDASLGHARWRCFVGEALRRELLTPAARAELETPLGEHVRELRRRSTGRPELDRELYVDLKSYLADNCLVKVDRMSMACSLEARVPLLDHELVELAFRIPPELKVRGMRLKRLLKRVAARHLPDECVYRAKQGFSMPIKEWIRRELRPRAEELLDRRRLDREGILRGPTVERLLREHLERRSDHSHVLWGLMVLQAWRERWGAA